MKQLYRSIKVLSVGVGRRTVFSFLFFPIIYVVATAFVFINFVIVFFIFGINTIPCKKLGHKNLTQTKLSHILSIPILFFLPLLLRTLLKHLIDFLKN